MPFHIFRPFLFTLLALAAVLGFAAPGEGSYSFRIEGGPAPGYGGSFANADYRGPDDYGGSILARGFPQPGIGGAGTPLNSGHAFADSYLDFWYDGRDSLGGFEVFGHSGTDAGPGFSGTITASSMTGTGGSFTVDGFLGADAAAFFGVDPATELVGTATVVFTMPSSFLLPDVTGIGRIASLRLTLTAVPEPASLAMMGFGVGIVGAWRARRTARRAFVFTRAAGR